MDARHPDVLSIRRKIHGVIDRGDPDRSHLAVQIYEGRVGSLRRFKDDASEVQQGYECGVMVAGFNDLKQGDVIEAYEVIEEAAKL